MTYENDPNSRRGMRDNSSYTGWIIAGVAALAVIIGIFMMTGRTDNTNTATSTNRPAATAPVTTGSAPATIGAPATTGSAPTTDANRQNVPATPAR